MNSKAKFTIQHLIAIVLFLAINITAGYHSPWSTAKDDMPHFMNLLWIVVVLAVAIGWLIFVLDDTWKPFGYKDDEFYEKWSLSFKSKSWIFWVIIAFIGYLVYGQSGKVIEVYNTSVVYNKAYDKAVQARIGFYDNLWKTYLQKEKITNLNRETFLEVTKTIMENRKDGSSIAWKWVQENQQIPYDEFTSFYKDLSNFIETKRDDYYKLEMQTQDIVNAHNMLIDTFPNNLYNKILGRKPLVFNYGLLSDSTKAVFKSGVENIK